MTFTLASRSRGCGAICADILAELPDWFGIPASNAAYAELAEAGPAMLALDGDEPIGLMILKRHGDEALENYLLAVRLQRRHSGVGRALIAEADRIAHLEGRRYLTVKTLGPSHPSAPYAETRAFYRAVGFTPLEEFTEIWGPENPCLFMVRPVGAPS
jgi:GNAT superfamily N-acetyltransferase